MKVVINRCYGGFSISRAAAEHMAAAGSETARLEIAQHDETLAAFAFYRANGTMPEGSDAKGWREGIFRISAQYDSPPKFYGYGYVDGHDGYRRDDPLLVAAVEALGEASAGECADLRVVEIPDGTDYGIDEYDGMEHIAEKHRTWA